METITSILEAARLAGVTRRTIYNWLNRQEDPLEAMAVVRDGEVLVRVPYAERGERRVIDIEIAPDALASYHPKKGPARKKRGESDDGVVRGVRSAAEYAGESRETIRDWLLHQQRPLPARALVRNSGALDWLPYLDAVSQGARVLSVEIKIADLDAYQKA